MTINDQAFRRAAHKLTSPSLIVQALDLDQVLQIHQASSEALTLLGYHKHRECSVCSHVLAAAMAASGWAQRRVNIGDREWVVSVALGSMTLEEMVANPPFHPPPVASHGDGQHEEGHQDGGGAHR